MDDIAHVHQAQTDASGDRRGDPGIDHLDLGRRDIRPVACYRSYRLAHQRLLIVVVLRCDHPLLVQGFIPGQSDFRIEQGGLVLR